MSTDAQIFGSEGTRRPQGIQDPVEVHSKTGRAGLGNAKDKAEKPRMRKEEFLFSDSDDMEDAKSFGFGQGGPFVQVRQ